VIRTYLTIKLLFGMALRKTTVLVESLLRRISLNGFIALKAPPLKPQDKSAEGKLKPRPSAGLCCTGVGLVQTAAIHFDGCLTLLLDPAPPCKTPVDMTRKFRFVPAADGNLSQSKAKVLKQVDQVSPFGREVMGEDRICMLSFRVRMIFANKLRQTVP